MKNNIECMPYKWFFTIIIIAILCAALGGCAPHCLKHQPGNSCSIFTGK